MTHENAVGRCTRIVLLTSHDCPHPCTPQRKSISRHGAGDQRVARQIVWRNYQCSSRTLKVASVFQLHSYCQRYSPRFRGTTALSIYGWDARSHFPHCSYRAVLSPQSVRLSSFQPLCHVEFCSLFVCHWFWLKTWIHWIEHGIGEHIICYCFNCYWNNIKIWLDWRFHCFKTY